MFLKILLIIAIFLNAFLSVFVLTQNPKSNSNRLFALLALLGAMWTFTNYMTGISTSIYWLNSSYAFGSLVIAAGLMWTLIITEKKIQPKSMAVISIMGIIFFICAHIPGFMAQSYEQSYLKIMAINAPGEGAALYLIYYVIMAYLIINKLFIKQKAMQNINERTQIRFILCGALIALFTSFISTILPLVSQLSMWGIDAIGFLVFIIFIAYSITKHRLFNIRVIAIEIVTFAIWITLLIRIFTAQTQQDLFVSLGLLITTIIFGILLIRSTINEILQLEHIDKLTEELRKTYASVHQLNDALDRRIAVQMEEKSTVDKVWKGANPEDGSTAL